MHRLKERVYVGTNARFEINPVSKVVMINIATDSVHPGFLYYMCEYILTSHFSVDDWQDWFVQLTDIRVQVHRLKNMTEWDTTPEN